MPVQRMKNVKDSIILKHSIKNIIINFLSNLLSKKLFYDKMKVSFE